jgi:hypothetical protein
MYVPAWLLPGNGSVTMGISTAATDHGGYKRKGYKYLGNAGESASSDIILILIWKFEVVVLENMGRKCRNFMAELFSCS